jgi:transposase
MDRCVLNQQGEILVHRNMPAGPESLLKAVAPSRAGLVVGVECIFTWYGLADLGAREGMAVVLGHALSMQAIHGGKATHDRIDAQKRAVLLRGGMLPQAYVSPAEMRATRDLRRRRRHLMRKRAELLAHIHNTHSQYNLPESGKKIAYKANRDGGAKRFADPAGQKSIAVALALIGHYDQPLRAMDLSVLKTAKHHHANTLSLLRPVPGLGESLRLVLLYESPAIPRFPRVQDFVSYCRLSKCAKESAGPRAGTAGAKIGHAYLTWALSEAAGLLLRANPAGQKYWTRLENKHGKGKALIVLAHKLARAVYHRVQRETAFDRQRFLQS